MSDKFIKFLGGCFLAGKSVAIYKSGEGYRVTAETAGGNPVRFQQHSESGKRGWKTLPSAKMSEEQYEAFEDRVTRGLTPQDANIVARALVEMGYPEDLIYG